MVRFRQPTFGRERFESMGKVWLSRIQRRAVGNSSLPDRGWAAGNALATAPRFTTKVSHRLLFARSGRFVALLRPMALRAFCSCVR